MVEITLDSVAHGGEAVGRLDGKACFVPGAMPGERAEIEIVKEKARWSRGHLVRILEPSPDRIEPKCPAFGVCGGCTWQHATYGRQLAWKRETVAGQLRHLGGLEGVTVRPTTAPGEPYGYRNRMDFAVADGRPALHRQRSDRLVALEACPLLRPELAERFAELGDLTGTRKVTLRLGVNTGDVLIMVEGRVPAAAPGWRASVVTRNYGNLHAVRGRASYEEEVAGVRLTVPASAFFQVNTAGAETLVRLVTEAAAVTGDDVLLDGYAGVGLFAATVGRTARRVVTIDSGRAEYRAIDRNLGRVVPGRFVSLLGSFEETAPAVRDRWDVAIVDPPRSGLGSVGVDAVTRTAPRTIVLISCDPASLARDAALLTGAGYRLDTVQPVDLFPQTFHIETVARFSRR